MRTSDVLEQLAKRMEPGEERNAIEKAVRTLRTIENARTVILLHQNGAHIITHNGERTAIRWNHFLNGNPPPHGNGYTITRHPYFITYFYPRAIRIQYAPTTEVEPYEPRTHP